ETQDVIRIEPETLAKPHRLARRQKLNPAQVICNRTQRLGSAGFADALDLLRERVQDRARLGEGALLSADQQHELAFLGLCRRAEARRIEERDTAPRKLAGYRGNLQWIANVEIDH